MKMKIIGMMAIVIAISASAFTAPAKPVKKGNIMYYWFLISDGITSGSQVPQADATFLQESSTPPTNSQCSSGSDQCVSGFTSNQVNGLDQLKDNHQEPASAGQTQP